MCFLPGGKKAAIFLSDHNSLLVEGIVALTEDFFFIADDPAGPGIGDHDLCALKAEQDDAVLR